VVASDKPSNAADSALSGELESVAFEIDNTPPEIVIGGTRVEGSRTVITFDVKDDNSPIQRVEVSQDGLQWRSVFPVDGIADAKLEHYVVTIDGSIGPRGVTLRASDSMNNIATATVVR
jgi:flavin-binding protein dodecin